LCDDRGVESESLLFDRVDACKESVAIILVEQLTSSTANTVECKIENISSMGNNNLTNDPFTPLYVIVNYKE